MPTCFDPVVLTTYVLSSNCRQKPKLKSIPSPYRCLQHPAGHTMALAKNGSVDRHKLTRWCSCSPCSFDTWCRSFGARSAQIFDDYLLDNACREPLLLFAQSRPQHKDQKQYEEVEIGIFARSLPRVATSVEGNPWSCRKKLQICTTVPWRGPYAGSDHISLCRRWRSYCRCLWDMGRLEVARRAAWRNFLGFFTSRQVTTVFPANLHGVMDRTRIWIA